jgi:CRAL/TRIO domain
VDLVRSCFAAAKNGVSSEREAELHAQIERDFSRQVVVMRGLSLGVEGTISRSSDSEQQQQQQPVLIKFPRHEGGTTEEEYIQTQIYIVERAVACTEFATRGRHEKVLVVMDGGGGGGSSGSGSSSASHAPPVSWQLTAIRRVQHLYPERLGRLIIVDAPFWMRGIYHSIRPFLPPSTRHKIQLVSSSSSSSTVRCCCCCCK